MDEYSVYPSAPRKARIEIIPLIDVIFFLLATFVLFTLSLDKIKAIEVPLPKVPGEPVPPQAMLYLQASAQGTVYWKDGDSSPELLSMAELAPRLAHYRSTQPNPRVLVRGDNKATFGATVRVLDEVRNAKIMQVSVETLTSKTGQ